jgi:hypothetical protein
MYRIGMAAIVLVALAGGRADAETFDVHDLYRKAEALAQSLFRPGPADREVIKPSGSIDPRMALAPPPGGTMRLVEPSEPFRQR